MPDTPDLEMSVSDVSFGDDESSLLLHAEAEPLSQRIGMSSEYPAGRQHTSVSNDDTNIHDAGSGHTPPHESPVSGEIYPTPGGSGVNVHGAMEALPPVKQKGKSAVLRTCKLCSYKTATLGNMSRHERAVHTNVHFTCDTCSRSFTEKYDLKEHIRVVHQGMRLICEFCAKLFHSRKTLIRHRRIFHQPHREPRFSCGLCFKTFFEKLHYDGHMNKHVEYKPYTCTRCNKSFGYKSSMHRHTLSCTNANRDKDKFQCAECGMGFKSKVILDDHMTGKHGAKNRVCPCGKTFSWRSSFNRHKKTCNTYQVEQNRHSTGT